MVYHWKRQQFPSEPLSQTGHWLCVCHSSFHLHGIIQTERSANREFPFLRSNILSLPAYGVFIPQLVPNVLAHSLYECFILRARRLSSKLIKQRYPVERLKSSFRKFYGRYGNLIQQYEVSLSRMLNDILTLDKQ